MLPTTQFLIYAGYTWISSFSSLCCTYLNFHQVLLTERTVWVLPKCFIVLSTKFGSREWENCLVVNISDSRFNHSLPPLFYSEESSFSFPSFWFLILEKMTQLLTMLVVEDSIRCSLLYNRSLYWLCQVPPGLVRQAGVIITWTHPCWVLQNFSSQEPKSYSVSNKSCLQGGFWLEFGCCLCLSRKASVRWNIFAITLSSIKLYEASGMSPIWWS